MRLIALLIVLAMVAHHSAAIVSLRNYVTHGTGTTTDDNHWSGTLCSKGSYFYGCTSGTATAYQWIDVRRWASLIDQGNRQYYASASLGGYQTQSDYALVTLYFSSSTGSVGNKGTASTAAVYKSDRGSVTKLLKRQVSGNIPSGTRWIRYTIRMYRTAGTNNDAYSDNHVFQIDSSDQPSGFNLIGGEYGDALGLQAWTGTLCTKGSYFYGCKAATATATQTVDLSNYASLSSGVVAYTMSAALGGYSTQQDQAAFAAKFYNSGTLLSTTTLGPVTLADRGGATGLLSRSASGTVNAQTTSITFQLTLVRDSRHGSTYNNDGYSDNLRFTMSSGPDQCLDSCLYARCTAGQSFTVTVVGGVSANVFGNGHYTDDSNVGAAALHAGVVGLGETKSVTVHCTGPQNNFTAAEKNGVQSQAFGSWGSSMSFEGDASLETTPNPVSTLPPQPENCFDPLCILNKCTVHGSTFEIVVTGAASASPAVYGTSTFTDDSNVLSAVVHAGVLLAGQTGTVKVTCTGPQTTYTGSEENGVVSQSYGDWPYSFEVALVLAYADPPEDICTTCLERKCGTAGTSFRVSVLGTTTAKIWGTSAYSDDSHVGVAAVHAGIVQVGETREIVATCQGPQQSFTGSLQNSVQSNDFAFPWPGSYSLVPSGTNPEPQPCVGQCAHNECSVIGARRYITVTGATFGTAWGVDKYTDDSNVQLAAVHMGLVEVGATATLVLTCSGPADTWPSSTRHGATTTAYNQYWGYSFKLALQ